MISESTVWGGLRQMWLSKPIYESIPYFYFVAGLASLGVSYYLDYSYWPILCFSVGFGCLLAGTVVWLRRRDSRRNKQRSSHENLN